jgi:hypothetical protein
MSFLPPNNHSDGMGVSNEGDKVRLCEETLLRLNEESISSFSDGSRAFTICGISYRRIFRKALVSNRWTFTRTYGALVPLSEKDSPSFPWTYRFPLPSDCINLIGVMFPPDSRDDGVDTIASAYGIVPNNQYARRDSYGMDYERRDGCVCANWRNVAIDSEYAVPETMLGNYPLFRSVVLFLAFEFAMSVMNDDGKLKLFTALVQEAYGVATSTDSACNPVPITNHSSVVTKMKTFG